jgi:hypothetical protein
MKLRFAAAMAALFGLSACGAAAIKTNPAATFPVPAEDNAPAFLFPINISHAGTSGNADAIGAGVTAAFAGKYGKKVVSGQQLFDLVGNLSFELAEGIRSSVEGGRWTMGGSEEKVASDLAAKMEDILNKLAELGLIEKGYKFKFIIALHSHGANGMLPKSVNVNSWGGIYEVESKAIWTYIDANNTIVDDGAGAAVLGLLPDAYVGIVDRLMAGK